MLADNEPAPYMSVHPGSGISDEEARRTKLILLGIGIVLLISFRGFALMEAIVFTVLACMIVLFYRQAGSGMSRKRMKTLKHLGQQLSDDHIKH